MQWANDQISEVERVQFHLEPGGYDVHHVDLLLDHVVACMRAGTQIPDGSSYPLRTNRFDTGYARGEVQGLLERLQHWRAGAAPAAPPARSVSRSGERDGHGEQSRSRIAWTREQMDWVRGQAFTPARRGGYIASEVDDFLDDVLVAMGHGRELPDVHGAQFGRGGLGRPGYDMREVDGFLDELLKIRPVR